MHRFSDDIAPRGRPTPPYWATGMDLGVAVSAPFSDSELFPGAQGCLIGGLCLLDLPIALVGDTICLPFDTYSYVKWRIKRKRDEGTQQHGVQVSSEGAPSAPPNEPSP